MVWSTLSEWMPGLSCIAEGLNKQCSLGKPVSSPFTPAPEGNQSINVINNKSMKRCLVVTDILPTTSLPVEKAAAGQTGNNGMLLYQWNLSVKGIWLDFFGGLNVKTLIFIFSMVDVLVMYMGPLKDKADFLFIFYLFFYIHQGGYVLTCTGLFVCWENNSKSIWQIFMKLGRFRAWEEE